MTGDPTPDASDVAEMAETVTLLNSGLDAVGRYVDWHRVSEVAQAAAYVADDRGLVAAWQRASRRARIEALSTVASLAAQVGASIHGAPPDEPAGVLLACAAQQRRAPLPQSGTGVFGPLTGPTAACAAGLVREGGIAERDQRVVFAVLGLHAVTTDDNNDPVAGRDVR
jgi:hypothetical protein